MSAGRPIWCTGMIAFVRGGDRALGRDRVEVVGARVDVGEDRRRAALPDRVGGGDERQRRHDDLVARADAGRRRARAAAPWCSSSSRWRRPRRRARRTRPRRPARAGPGRPSRTRSTCGERLGLAAVEVRTRERDLHHDGLRERADGLEAPVGAVLRPPLDEPGEALLEADLGLEAELLAGGGRVGEPARHLVDRALGAVLDRSGPSP